VSQLVRSPHAAERLAPRTVTTIHAAFAASLHVVFIDLLSFALLILGGAILLKEVPLRREAPITTQPEADIDANRTVRVTHG
jgi:hypothetical protein